MDKTQTLKDFRDQLYDKFSGNILNVMQAQMRSYILSALKNHNDIPNNKLQSSEATSLCVKVVNSLIYQHMQVLRYDYSSAVFVPEAVIAIDNVNTQNSIGEFQWSDILNVLKLSKNSQLNWLYYKLNDIINNDDNIITQNSILLTLLNALGEKADETMMNDKSCQVNDDNDLQFRAINLKLEAVDQDHKNKNNNIADEMSDNKIMKYQVEIEEQLRHEMQKELQIIREQEISTMRLEERERFTRELQDVQDKYKSEYDKKLQELKRKEDVLNAQYVTKEKRLQAEHFALRQRLLNDMERWRIAHDENRSSENMNDNNKSIEKIEQSVINDRLHDEGYVKEQLVRSVQYELQISQDTVEKLRYRINELESSLKEKTIIAEQSVIRLEKVNDKLKMELSAIDREHTNIEKRLKQQLNQTKIELKNTKLDLDESNLKCLSQKRTIEWLEEQLQKYDQQIKFKQMNTLFNDNTNNKSSDNNLEKTINLDQEFDQIRLSDNNNYQQFAPGTLDWEAKLLNKMKSIEGIAEESKKIEASINEFIESSTRNKQKRENTWRELHLSKNLTPIATNNQGPIMKAIRSLEIQHSFGDQSSLLDLYTNNNEIPDDTSQIIQQQSPYLQIRQENDIYRHEKQEAKMLSFRETDFKSSKRPNPEISINRQLFDVHTSDMNNANQNNKTIQKYSNIQDGVDEIKYEIAVGKARQQDVELQKKKDNVDKLRQQELESQLKKELEAKQALERKHQKELELQKRKEEEEALERKRIEELELRKRKEEEEAKRKRKRELELQRKKELDLVKQALERKRQEDLELQKRKEEEETAAERKRQEELELQKRKEEEEEAAKRKRQEELELQKRKEEEEEAAERKRQEELELQKRKEEEAAAAERKRQEELELQKRKEEEEAERKRQADLDILRRYQDKARSRKAAGSTPSLEAAPFEEDEIEEEIVVASPDDPSNFFTNDFESISHVDDDNILF